VRAIRAKLEIKQSKRKSLTNNPFEYISQSYKMTTSLHFGPEWMRDKRTARSRASQDASPPPGQTPLNGTSYSSVLTPTNITPQSTEVGDSAHPFRYAKEDILQVWRDGGGRTGLGLEVERWEGIIRECAGEPIGIKDLSDSERKVSPIYKRMYGGN
jgi:PERQ amino acid-rich with GYF domain-containing protein